MKQKIFFTLALIFSVATTSFIFANNKKNTCANSVSCIDNLLAVAENDVQGTFLGNSVVVPPIDLTLEPSSPEVLGKEIEQEESDSSSKHIYIDLSEQKLYAFDGNKMFLETLISTGLWGRTPVGEYRIWVKIRSTKMSGGSGNDYYYLPNVPYVMYFYNSKVPKSRGFGLHGTYWHNNFGNEMSHGCVNLRTTDAGILYNWVSPTTIRSTTHATKKDPGTAISICNKIQLQEGATPLCLE